MVRLSRGPAAGGVSEVMLGVMLPALWLPFCAYIYGPTYLFGRRGHLLPVAMASEVVAIGSFVWAMALAIPVGFLLQRRGVAPLFAAGAGILASVVAFYVMLLFFSAVAGSHLFGVLLADPFARLPLARLIAPAVVAGLGLLVAANRSRA